MNHQSHYRSDSDTGCNVAITDRALVVNCCGACVIPEPFSVRNGQGRHDMYLMHLWQGALDIKAGTCHQTLRAGHMLLTPPETSYAYAKKGSETLGYHWVHFSGNTAMSLLASLDMAPSIPYQVGSGPEVEAAFQSLIRQFIHRDACFELAASVELARLLVLLRRQMDGQAPSSPRSDALRLSASFEYLHRHYAEPLCMAELAEREHLSVSRFCSLFRDQAGQSPQNYLIELRLRTAAALLRNTDLSLKAIARSVGYHDPLYFSRLFKSRKGLSPSLYAKKAQSMS